MKPCIICHKIKPIDDFYRQKGMKDGHLNKCKSCCRIQAQFRKEHNIHRIRREIKAEKPCIVCHKIKALEDFYKHKGMLDGHLNKCIECCNKYYYKERRTNPHYYLRCVYNSMSYRCRELNRYKKLKLLSKDDWTVWTSHHMTKFLKLYRNWQKNGYKVSSAPSIDRIDNSRGYEADNMQWLTQSQNARKQNK